MIVDINRRQFFCSSLFIIFINLLTACGSGSELITLPDTSNSQTDENLLSDTGAQDSENSTLTSLTGSVGDGPVVNATLTFLDSFDKVLLTTKSDTKANYSAQLPSSTQYPVIITATGGIDLVTQKSLSFSLKSVVMSPADTTVNLNPFSTVAVQVALAMPGGLTETNLAIAKQIVNEQLNFGMDLELITDVITTPITYKNAAVMVKASETLAEAIRRTQNALIAADVTISQDALILSLADDLVDGTLDGQGGVLSNTFYTAVMNVISAKVLIESLSNNLYVNGFLSTSSMDNSINVLLGLESSNISTTDVLPTANMLLQAQRAVTAVQTIAPNQSFNQILAALTNFSSSQLFSDLSIISSSDARLAFNDSTEFVLSSDITVWDTVNSVVNDTYDFTGENNIVDNIPIAVDDAISAVSGTVTVIDVLANDIGLLDLPLTLSLISEPTNGVATLGLDKLFSYISNMNFSGTDTFSYKITDSDNDVTTATVSIQVICDNCVSDLVLSLSWNANTDSVEGYRIFYGTSPDTANQQVMQTVDTKADLNAQSDLGLTVGNDVCFKLKGYNSVGESDFSSAICTTL